MGTTIISVECIDQSLNIKKKPLIASGGIECDTIEFTFCALWDGFSKVAVFYRNEREVYHVEICDDKCTIPKEVLVNPGYLYFGVFGVKDGVTRTSSVISYKVEAGAITDGIKPPEPTPSIYEKILKHEEEIAKKLNASELPTAINTALAQAKESGEFDGPAGADGYTPVKGVDYYTDADRDELVQAVMSALPSGGTDGQVLTRTETGHEWRDLPSGLPDGGNPGDVLVRTESGAEWQAMDKLASEDADELMNMLK